MIEVKEDGPVLTGEEFMHGYCPDGQPHKLQATAMERMGHHQCCQVMHCCTNCDFQVWVNNKE